MHPIIAATGHAEGRPDFAGRRGAPSHGGEQAGRQGRLRPIIRNDEEEAQPGGVRVLARRFGSPQPARSRTPRGAGCSPRCRGSGDLWQHLIAYVLPVAIRDTLVLLAGVGLLAVTIGTCTAWLVTAYDFAGRRIIDWALLLPIAVPTYIIAYAYLDILHPVGPVQTALRALLGIDSPRDLRLPDIRSMTGCIALLGFVLYPVRLPHDARDVRDAVRESHRRVAHARDESQRGVLQRRAAAGPARDRRRPHPRAARSAQRHRRVGISGGPHAHRVDLLDVGDAVGPAGRGADSARHAGDGAAARGPGAARTRAAAVRQRCAKSRVRSNLTACRGGRVPRRSRPEPDPHWHRLRDSRGLSDRRVTPASAFRRPLHGDCERDRQHDCDLASGNGAHGGSRRRGGVHDADRRRRGAGRAVPSCVARLRRARHRAGDRPAADRKRRGDGGGCGHASLPRVLVGAVLVGHRRRHCLCVPRAVSRELRPGGSKPASAGSRRRSTMRRGRLERRLAGVCAGFIFRCCARPWPRRRCSSSSTA